MKRIQTKTGDIMQVSECSENDVTYGAISVTLKHTFTNHTEADTVLLVFLKKLQAIFSIEHAAGIHFAQNTSASHSVFTDYWQDADRKDWRIKGCTNGKVIHVSYIKNISQLPVEIEDYFFSAMLFP